MFVQNRFEHLGYDVRRTRIRVPSGSSWGTPVPRGTSLNVIAEPAGFDANEPHVVVGAHLDTVPVAPGAEDNASGIAVMLQLAGMVSQQPAALPVQFVAFGAEEPRGNGDARHHFGSREFVAGLSRSERRAIQAMVSLDRVGVRAAYVPVCTATDRGNRLRDAIRAAARQAEIPTRACTNFASDHWSFAKAGIPAVPARQHPYAGTTPAAMCRMCGRPAAARSGRPNSVGLVADTQLTAGLLSHCANGPRLLRSTSARMAAARFPDELRSEGVIDHVRDWLDRLHSAAPQQDSKKMPSRVLV
jgi:hypothetical protein